MSDSELFYADLRFTHQVLIHQSYKIKNKMLLNEPADPILVKGCGLFLSPKMSVTT